MAKVSPVSIKYMIFASFNSAGPLEKPDVIGAIFGQTEGLLGEDLEMRELQKEGKIGRIEVDLEIVDGKSVGEIQIPSAMDKSETTIIAAAMETIDRIGPTEASIKISKIEDVRGSKRDFIISRAKELLERVGGESGVGEMSKELKDQARVSKIQDYGSEKLPAGDLSGNEVIVVEGRADVVNLLKNRINNVIGMDGTKLPKEITTLGESKELTLFVDGDRGGKLIAKNVIDHAKVKYIAIAPDGKEVEELTGKEILIALRRKISVNEYLSKNGFSTIPESSSNDNFDETDAKAKIKNIYSKEISGSRKAVLLDSEMDVIKKIGLREVSRNISSLGKKAFAVVIDGTANSGIIRACDENNVKLLGATNFTGVGNCKVKLISL